jgi:hypothetical protein
MDDQIGLIKNLSFPLYNCRGWMKFVGVMSIIGGALQVLTIFGIIIAWLPIWTGILLFQSANAITEAYEGDNQAAMTRALLKLKTYFIIMGVLTLIGIVFMVLVLFLCLLGTGLSLTYMSHRAY